MRLTDVYAVADETDLAVAVSSAPGSAGAAIGSSAVSSRLRIWNPNAGDIDYRVGSADWKTIGRDQLVAVEVNLSTTSVYLRKGSPVAGTVTVPVVIEAARELVNSATSIKPVMTAAPALTGTPTIGTPVAFTAATAAGTPTPTVLHNIIVGGVGKGSAYTPVSDDAGKPIFVRAHAKNAAGSSDAVASAAATVAGSALSIGATPVTSGAVGTAYGGFTASAAGGTTPYAYKVAFGSLPPGVSLNASTGAVSGTPTRDGAYTGIVIRVTDASGAFADLAMFTLTVAAGVVPAPVNTVLPAITGTAQDGQTLTVSDGTWSNSPTSYARQWKRGGVAISGATGTTYACVTADVGSTLTCTVTATNAGGSASATSASTGTVAAAGGAADTRPGWFAAPSNAASSGTAGYVSGRTKLTGSSNGGKAGTANPVTTSGANYCWFAIANSGTVTFTDNGSGFTGGFTAAGTFNDGTTTWYLFKSDYPASYSAASITIS